MGLSDSEQYYGAIQIINELYKLPKFQGSDHKHLNPILRSLWYATLGETKNSAHWFMGSSSTSDHLQAMGLFAVAMSNSYNLMHKEENSLEKASKKYLESNPVSKYLEDYCPTAVSLLQATEYSQRYGEMADVLKIYRLIEQYFYYVNRYPGNIISRSFKPVTKKITVLQGECFEIMSKNKAYVKAWMLESIFSKIVPDHTETDLVSNVMKEFNLHHYISLSSCDDILVMKLFKQYQPQVYKPKTQQRLLALFRFTGTQFHYAHLHKKLIQMIEDHNVREPKDLVGLELIRKMCSGIIKSKESKDKAERKSKPHRTYCHLTGQYI